MRHETRLARHASERAIGRVEIELKRGLTSLASIAATAPLLGFLATVFEIVLSFKGLGSERSTAMAWLAHDLSQSLAPAALGLVVGIAALAAYRCFSERVEIMLVEMKRAAVELERCL